MKEGERDKDNQRGSKREKDVIMMRKGEKKKR